MTLRARLTVALVALVAVALVVTDVVTYMSLRSFLTNRLDEQLVAARDPVARTLLQASDPFFFGERGALPPLPTGSYGELLDANGTTIASVYFSFDEAAASGRPVLPDELPSDAEPFTIGSTGDHDYRTLVTPVRGGGSIVVAVPLTEVSNTLARLTAILVAVTAVVLAGLGTLAMWLVRRELRPLRQMEETAGRIASGDLAQRIQAADPDTEVGRLGASLNAMLAQIEQAFGEKEASEDRLRRFLADASHELRTPLTSIRGYAELFRRGADARPEDLAKAMRRIEDEATRMTRLVEDLLLLARLDEGRPLEREPLDLAIVARDAAAAAAAVDPDRTIDVTGPETLPVDGDAARLRQVADNLVRNALVHTPPGTPVHVRVRVDDGHAILEVEDEGPGIEPEEAARVFERFHRSESARASGIEGAGLGLSIAVAIARAHGGAIELDPRPGEGARFRIVLPLEREPEPVPA